MNGYEIDLNKIGLITEDNLLNSVVNNLNANEDDINKDWRKQQTDKGKNPEDVEDIDNINLRDQQLKRAGTQLGKIDNALNSNRIDTTSIVGRAKRSVLQFPIYMTQSIRVSEAHTIGKLFERVYATLVQSVLSQHPIINEDDVNNLRFLKQFHTNLREAAENFVNKYYEPIDEIDHMIKESIFYQCQISQNVFCEFRAIPCIDKDLIAENSRLINEPLAGFHYLKEDNNNRVKTVSTTTRETFRGGQPDRIITPLELKHIVDDYNQKNNTSKTVSDIEKGIQTSPHGWQFGETERIYARRNSNFQPPKYDKHGYVISPGVGEEWEYYIPKISDTKDIKTNVISTEPDIPKDPRDPVEIPKLTRDADLKKFNGLLPWTIEASFRIKTPQGLDRDVKFVIGIKSVMHLISPSDLSSELRELITGNVKSLQKVRYKTGEIDLKDYLFNTKALKADASKHINPNKRWINTHKRLGEYNKLHGSLLQKPIKAITGGNVPIPNGTLVLAQPDITKLTNETGIDLSIVSNSKRLAQALFLIAVVIVDSTAGTMRVLFTDNDTDWDVQSLAAIDAEIAKTDNSGLMRELNRSINR